MRDRLQPPAPMPPPAPSPGELEAGRFVSDGKGEVLQRIRRNFAREGEVYLSDGPRGLVHAVARTLDGAFSWATVARSEPLAIARLKLAVPETVSEGG